MKIAIACGGTGGHFFPGRTVGFELERRGHVVTLWIGCRDIERVSLDSGGLGVIRMPVEGFAAGSPWGGLRGLWRLAMGYRESVRRMKQARPDVVLGMGSYASVGPVLAARRLGIPVCLHEANAVPGRAIVFLSRYAEVVATTFDETRQYLEGVKVAPVGFPVREDLSGTRLWPEGFTVLVMGGSQGAHRLNETASEALCDLACSEPDIQVVHLAGECDAARVRDRYKQAGLRHKVFGFLDAMGQAYASADLAVARAGAATCAELAACRLPALLIPLPGAVRDHQAANARALAASGGVDLLAERELTAEGLAAYVRAFRKDSGKRKNMRDGLAKVQLGGGCTRLADLVETVMVRES